MSDVPSSWECKDRTPSLASYKGRAGRSVENFKSLSASLSLLFLLLVVDDDVPGVCVGDITEEGEGAEMIDCSPFVADTDMTFLLR